MNKKDKNPADPEQQFAQALEAKHAQLMANADSDQVIADEEDQRIQSAMMVLQLLEDFKAPQASPEVATDETVDDPLTKPSLRQPSSTAIREASTERALPDLERLGRFDIIEQVGRGGFGIVVRAHDPQLGRDVAIKIPRFEAALSPQSRQRFEREAKAAAALNHPNIVGVLESGSEQGIDFIVTEFVDGENLATLLAKGESLSTKDAAQLVASIADAMEHAHQRGVLHRDLKPSNILLRDNELQSPLIADFGLATITDEIDFTQTGAVIGTPAYMSPEQAAGKKQAIGPTTDVYGLGTILYQLLTGRSPFADLPLVKVLDAIHRRDPEPPRSINGQVPRDLESICLKCLEKNPDRRYQSAQELQADLQRFLAGQSVIARRIRGPEKFARWFKRNPLVGTLSTSFAVAMLIALIAVTSLWQQSESNRIIAEQNKQQYLKKSEQLTEAVNRLFLGLANNTEIQNAEAEGLRKTLLEEANRFQEMFLSEAPDDPELILEYARSLKRLAEINLLLGAYSKGIELTEAAIEQADRIKNDLPVSPLELTDWFVQLARVNTKIGDFDQARIAFEAATKQLNAVQSKMPADHPTLLIKRAVLFTNQAYSSLFQDDVKSAMDFADLAIKLWQSAPVADTAQRDGHFKIANDMALSHFVYAEALRLQGKHKDSIPHFQKSLDIYTRSDEPLPTSPDLQFLKAKTLRSYGIAQAEQKQTIEARANYEAALEILDPMVEARPLVENYSSMAAQTRYSLAATESVSKNYERAIELLKQNIAEKEKLIENFPDSKAKYYSFLGDSYNLYYYTVSRQNAAADDVREDLLNKSISAFESSLKLNPDWMRPRMAIGRAWSNLGYLQQRQKKHPDAAKNYDRALKSLDAILKEQPNWFEARNQYYGTSINMISLHIAAGNLENAIEVVDALTTRFPDHPRTNAMILGKPKLMVQAGRWQDAAAELSKFVEARAKNPKDYLSAAEKAIEISLLEDEESESERSNRFADLALDILKRGKPQNQDKLNAYFAEIKSSKTLSSLLEKIQ